MCVAMVLTVDSSQCDINRGLQAGVCVAGRVLGLHFAWVHHAFICIFVYISSSTKNEAFHFISSGKRKRR